MAFIQRVARRICAGQVGDGTPKSSWCRSRFRSRWVTHDGASSRRFGSPLDRPWPEVFLDAAPPPCRWRPVDAGYAIGATRALRTSYSASCLQFADQRLAGSSRCPSYAPRSSADRYHSNPSPRSQRHRRPVADHEMVQQADLDQRQRLFQAGGDGAVGGGRLRIAGRVVVADDHRRRVVGQGAAHDFARMHFGAIDRALEQFLEAPARGGGCPGTGRRRPRARVRAGAGRNSGRRWPGRSGLRRVPARRPGGDGRVPVPQPACRRGPGPARAGGPGRPGRFPARRAAGHARPAVRARSAPRRGRAGPNPGRSPAIRHPTARRRRGPAAFHGDVLRRASRVCAYDQLGGCHAPAVSGGSGASGKLTACTAIGIPRRGKRTGKPLERPAHPAVRRRRHRRLQGAGTGAPVARRRGRGAGGDDRRRPAFRHPAQLPGTVRQPDPHHPVGQRGRGVDGPYRTGALGRPDRRSPRPPPTCWPSWRMVSPTTWSPPCAWPRPRRSPLRRP